MSDTWSLKYRYPPHSLAATQKNVLAFSLPLPYYCPAGSLSLPSQSAVSERRTKHERGLPQLQQNDGNTRTRRWVVSTKEHTSRADKERKQRRKTERIQEIRSNCCERLERSISPRLEHPGKSARFVAAPDHGSDTHEATRPFQTHQNTVNHITHATYQPTPQDFNSFATLLPPTNSPATLSGYEKDHMRRLLESQHRSHYSFGEAAFHNEDDMLQGSIVDLLLWDTTSSNQSDRNSPFGLYERRVELEGTIRRQREAIHAHRAIADQMEHDNEHFEEELERMETRIVRYQQTRRMKKLNSMAISATPRDTGTRGQAFSDTHIVEEATAPHIEPPGHVASASPWLPLTEAGPSGLTQAQRYNLKEPGSGEIGPLRRAGDLTHHSDHSESSFTLPVLCDPSDGSRSDTISISSSNDGTYKVLQVGSDTSKIDKDTERLVAVCRVRHEQTRAVPKVTGDLGVTEGDLDVGVSGKGKGKEVQHLVSSE